MPVKAKILIAEEDENLQEVLRGLFRSLNHRVKASGDAAELCNLLEAEGWDAFFCDARLWESTRVKHDLLQLALGRQPRVPVVMTAHYTEIDLARGAVERGAFAWLPKPLKATDALRVLERILCEASALSSETNVAESPEIVSGTDRADQAMPAPEHHFGVLIGEHERMQELYTQIEKVSATTVTVLLRGDSGTGKELVAQAIHNSSARSDKPFVAVNCAALPEQLLESELFGHIKGAFTGAVRNKDGLFVAAQGGTLFLDEIGSIPVQMQLTLLRALQEREIRPVGGVSMIPVDVRVIAATNEDLEERLRSGLFREDLFYRLSVFPITLPRLAERRSDVLLLAQHFLGEWSQKDGRAPASLTDDAVDALSKYSWPGNVRELQNALRRAYTLVAGENQPISLRELPDEIRRATASRPQEGKEPSGIPSFPPRSAGMTLKAYLRACERQYVQAVLDECQGDKDAAAKKLGISLATFYRKYGGQ
ncbi:MAG: sigma 54-interacting transcriptional regulator [Lentisphaeria bacterium]|jgi:DNA-binding NtrC family response regulator